jgi:hypothetical protein
MSTDIRIIHAHDFIIATPEGQLDLEKSKKLLMDTASAAAPLVDYEIILDTRKAQTKMSETDLWHLAAELSNFRGAFFQKKIAILCPLEQFDHANSSCPAPKTPASKSGHSLLSKTQSSG